MCQVSAKDVEDNSEVSTYIFSAEFFMDVFNISFQGAKVSSLSNVLRKRLSQFLLINMNCRFINTIFFLAFRCLMLAYLAFFCCLSSTDKESGIHYFESGLNSVESKKKIIAAVNARFSFLFLSFYYFW